MRLRTLDRAAEYIREQDPDTDLTRTAIRRMGLAGTIPTVIVGVKRLYDLDTLENYVYGGQKPTGRGIRPVEVRQ